MSSSHPLDPLTADEIGAAVRAVRDDPRVPADARFADVELWEPEKPELTRAEAGGLERLVTLKLVAGPAMNSLEALVSATRGEVLSLEEVTGVCPTILLEETFNATLAVKGDPRWQDAMRRRGVDDLELVEVDPWPAGRFGLDLEEGRRLARCTSYLKEREADNLYARPIDGVIAFVDLGRAEVLRVEDHGVVPIPPRRAGYLASEVGPLRQDLRPLEIVQPEGPSFSVEGHSVNWQRWSLRLGMNAHEGLVLHTVGYRDKGHVRPVLHRASVSEMVVPYGDPGPMHGWKNAFDASEWGLGKAANSLERGCDCLGEVRYLDGVFAGERGDPYTIKNAVCVHEEDHGIGWKHVDLGAGTSEVRRSRRLVISSIVTAGNYDYGFYWYLYLDGTIQFEVKLTGIVSTVAVTDKTRLTHAERVTRELAAPNHQHLFNVRMDFDVDGTSNSVFEIDVERDDWGPSNRWGSGFSARSTLLETEKAARRVTDTAKSRAWKVVNPNELNAAGTPVGYKLIPGPTPTLLAQPDSSIARRAGFATQNLWVTRYSPEERRAAGEYPNQHPGGDGLIRWTEADRPIVDTDIVVWHTLGVTHVVRPEEFPVMPVESTGFALVPSGFFDRNPALDVPPSTHG